MMSSKNRNVFKTPKKVEDGAYRGHGSPSVRFVAPGHHRSPLGNIQVSSVVGPRGSPIRHFPQSHCTPPAPFFRIRNPFERTLVESLNTPICSPGMFKIRESSGNFKWDIEHVCLIKPAEIVACNSQFDPTPDPILERKATEAIDKFFSQEMIVPSPFDEAPKRPILLPMDHVDVHQTTPEGPSKCVSREAWCQTILSFPSDLPPNIESVLKPFYSYTKDQNRSCDPDNSANASLRRKLCFEETLSDEDTDNLDRSSFNPCVPTGALLRGLKRTFNEDPSKYPKCYNGNAIDQIDGKSFNNEIEHCSLSPVIQCHSRIRYQIRQGEVLTIKSPSLSPIGHTLSEDFKTEKISAEMSPKSQLDSHHSCNTSPFSQSTPEKSSVSSHLSSKSTPDNNMSETDNDVFQKSNRDRFMFSDDTNLHVLGHVKMIKRSQSDISVTSLGRSTQTEQLDLGMDISFDSSIHSLGESHRPSHEVLGATAESNLAHRHNTPHTWDSTNLYCPKESDSRLQDSLDIKCDNLKSKDVYKGSESTDKMLIKQNICDVKSAMHDEKEIELINAYQYVTPTKSNRITSFGRMSCGKKVILMSPTNMSLDNSFNLDGDRSQGYDSQYPYLHDTFNPSLNPINENLTKSPFLNYAFPQPKDSDPNYATVSFINMDSGSRENLCISKSNYCDRLLSQCDMTMCNSTKHQCNVDNTKSSNYNIESSSVSWKRFDSGFNEETSCDFSHQIDENFRQVSKKYSPIEEYTEDNKENVFFGNTSHKVMLRHGPTSHDSMSEIFSEDMVSFNCNFSSTPSKNTHKKF